MEEIIGGWPDELVVEPALRQRELEQLIANVNRTVARQGMPSLDAFPPEQPRPELEEQAAWEARTQVREVTAVLLRELEARLERLGRLCVRLSDDERESLAEILRLGDAQRNALGRILRLPEEDREMLAVAFRLSDEECRGLAELVQPTQLRPVPKPVVTIVDASLVFDGGFDGFPA